MPVEVYVTDCSVNGTTGHIYVDIEVVDTDATGAKKKGPPTRRGIDPASLKNLYPTATAVAAVQAWLQTVKVDVLKAYDNHSSMVSAMANMKGRKL